MRLPPGTASTITGPHRRGGFWRAALAGLTPQTAVIIAALLLARVSSRMWATFSSRPANSEAPVQSLSGRYATLLVMAVPMLIPMSPPRTSGPGMGRNAWPR